MAIQHHGTSPSTFPGNVPGEYAAPQGALFHTGVARDISLYYIGYFSQSIISSLAETLRLQLEKTEVPPRCGANCSPALSKWAKTSPVTPPYR